MSAHAKHFGFTADEYVEEALERASVVEVLDAWAQKHGKEIPSPSDFGNSCWEVRMVLFDRTLICCGATPDAARAAAAKAIESGEV